MIKPKSNIEKLSRMKHFGTDRSSFIRLDKNERTIPYPIEVYDEMLSKIKNESIPMYPDQSSLYRKLSSFLDIDVENLLLTPGSDSAIKSIYETYVKSGDKVIYLWPTYAMIDVYADMFEAKKVKIGYSSELELDFEKLMEEINNDCKAVFVANPNQPTGTLLEKEQIEELINKTKKTNTLLVFDEAYQQFSNQDSSKKYVDNFSHIIVVQTFSKAFGLASARLGYIITQKTNIDWLFKVKPYADINLFALKLGEYLLDNYWIVEKYVKDVNSSKDLLETEMKKLGIVTMKGFANFAHLKFPATYDLELVAKQMKDKGYLIRTTGSGLPAVLEGCIRVTVGPPEQMELFLNDFKNTISNAK